MAHTTMIQPWMTPEEMRAWLLAPADRQEYQRRLAIWILARQPMPAAQVADLLGVSVQAVWKWAGEYNHLGPEGLQRSGRGGRRTSLLPLAAEQALAKFLHRLRNREPQPSVRSLQPRVHQLLGREVPLHYLHRVLRRWPVQG